VSSLVDLDEELTEDGTSLTLSAVNRPGDVPKPTRHPSRPRKAFARQMFFLVPRDDRAQVGNTRQ